MLDLQRQLELIEKFLVLDREINSINNQIAYLSDITFSNPNKRDLERLHELIESREQIKQKYKEL